LFTFTASYLVMAEDDGETAFFQAQSMNTEYMGYDEDGRQGADISDSDDYDPSKTLQDQYSAPLTYSKPDLQNPASLSVSPAPRSANEASVSQEVDQTQQPTDKYPSQTPSSAESSASASVPLSNVYVHPKTRTVGGFVIEDDDEDNKGETEYEPPAVLGGEEGVGSVSTSMPEHPISENANETVSSSGVSIQPPAPDMASSKDVSNSSYSPTAPVASQNDASFIPGERLYSVQASHDSPAPTPPNNVASTSRGRLPHDRVGILEDRIKEDPRGDTTAWLELIGEHRSRNRIDSTREAYERFLKIFPSAVSFPAIYL
jgi:cleavage stimulation factor subunit 3